LIGFCASRALPTTTDKDGASRLKPFMKHLSSTVIGFSAAHVGEPLR
jgi:hypothetical protein